MFPQMGQLAHLLKNAGQIKENMKQMQERLKEARFIGEAGAGQVRITVDGRGEPVAVKLDPQLVADSDIELIEDLITAAIRDAIAKSREAVQKEMQAATGGLDMGGMMEMLGK